MLRENQPKQLCTYAGFYPAMQHILLRQYKMRRDEEQFCTVSTYKTTSSIIIWQNHPLGSLFPN